MKCVVIIDVRHWAYCADSFVFLVGGETKAALYLYTSDSPFNTQVISAYMINGVPIVPINSVNQLSSLGNTSSSQVVLNSSSRLVNRLAAG